MTKMDNSKLNILYLDDSKADILIFKKLILGMSGGNDQWKDMTMEEKSVPLEAIEDYDKYDGVILDFLLSAKSTGYEIAQQIRLRNKYKPIMLITGMSPHNLPSDTREWIDHVAYKWGVGAAPADQIFGVFVAFMRHVEGVRMASKLSAAIK